MQDPTKKGRGKARETFTNTVADRSSIQAILRKQDELIEALKALTAKLDADIGAGGASETDYAAAITDAIEKVKLVG